MRIIQNWDNSRLEDYLLFDYWQPFEAWCLLAGFDPKDIDDGDGLRANNLLESDAWANLSFEASSDKERQEIDLSISTLANNVERIRSFWLASDLDLVRLPPALVIEWAISKRSTPEWFDWAKQRNLYKPQDSLSFETAPWADPKNENYARELNIAVRAWIAVTSAPEKGKPKIRVRKWLDANYTDKELSKQAKERISIVVNWDKAGGAPRTE